MILKLAYTYLVVGEFSFFDNNFITPKNWNQVRCFSTGEVLNVYILYIIIQNHNMEYYSEMKGNGLLIHTTTYISRELRWMKKVNSKRLLLYNSIFMKFLKWQNYRNDEQIHHCLSLRRGWEYERSDWGFKSETRRTLVVMDMFYILTLWISIAWL